LQTPLNPSHPPQSEDQDEQDQEGRKGCGYSINAVFPICHFLSVIFPSTRKINHSPERQFLYAIHRERRPRRCQVRKVNMSCLQRGGQTSRQPWVFCKVNMVETMMEINERTANAANPATHVIEETSVDEPDEGFPVS
jgi:hypothetical protein